MTILFETALGILIVAVTVGVAVLVQRGLPKLTVTPGVEAVTLIEARGEAEGLEQAVRSLRYAPGRVVIADGGLSDGARARAELLAARFGAEVVRMDKITFRIEGS